MAGSLWGKLFYSSSSSSSGSAAKTDRRRGGQKKTGLSLSLTGSRHPQPISWSDIPVAVLAQALRCLPFQERCRCASVCTNWRAIILSAAAHGGTTVSGDDDDAAGAASRTQPCDVIATEEAQQLKLQQCPAIRYAPSAVLALNEYAPRMMQQLSSVTRLVLIDPEVLRCQLDGEAFTHTPFKPAVPVELGQLQKLQVLSVAISSPALLDVPRLPSSLRALHLDLASGFSVKQLSALCQALSDAAPQLPHLRLISWGCELDALLSSSGAAGLSTLTGCKQLTSLAFVEYQHMHPESSAHEGYALVPPVLAQLPSLQSLTLNINSGQRVDLTPAAAIPEVNLVITLAHYEQTPFNKLPSSITAVTGLTSLSLLMAEFDYNADQDLYTFNARPLAQCTRLRRLLLELHGVKSALHDLQGLAELQGLTELVVLLKCPDVHEARPDALPPSVSGGSSSSGGGGGSAGVGSGVGGGVGGAADVVVPAAPGSQDWDNSSGGLLASVQRVPGRLLSLFGGQQSQSSSRQRQGGHHRRSHSASSSSTLAASALSAHVAHHRQCQSVGLVSEEWVLALVDHALEQIRPDFALSIPRVSGKLLIATTSRLHLRQPENFTYASQPMLLASQLQIDLSNCGDCWGGESFLHPMSSTALRSWVSRVWNPEGVELLPASRYPVLGGYPGCRKRIDDGLRIAARRGVGGAAVVEAVMCTAEASCMSYFC